MFECDQYSRTIWRFPSNLFQQIFNFVHVFDIVSIAHVSLFFNERNFTTSHEILFHFRNSSGVLSSLRQRQQNHTPLPHLHSIVFNARNSPVFIVSEKPTIYLLSSIVHFFNNMKNTKIPIGNADWLSDALIGYIEKFAKNTSWSFSMNWFLRREVTFVLDLLKSSAFQQRIDKKLQLMIAYKLLCCLDDTQLNDILYIFSRFIFNIDLYEHKMNVTSMDEWKSLYAKVCVEYYLNSLNREVSARLHWCNDDWNCALN